MSLHPPKNLPKEAVDNILGFTSKLIDAIENSSLSDEFTRIEKVGMLQINVKALQDYIKDRGAQGLTEDERTTLREFIEYLEDILAVCDSLKMDFKAKRATKNAYTSGLRKDLRPLLDNFERRWPYTSQALNNIKPTVQFSQGKRELGPRDQSSDKARG